MEVYSELTEENPNGMTANSNRKNRVNGYGYDNDINQLPTATNAARSYDWSSSNTGTKFQKMSGMGGNSVSALKLESANADGSAQTDTCPETFEYIVPLKFWFCRNPGLALPLIALQYHEMLRLYYSTNLELFLDLLLKTLT